MASGRPYRSDGRSGRLASCRVVVGYRHGRVDRGREFSRLFVGFGRVDRLAEVFGQDVGRGLPCRTVRSAAERELCRAAARRCLPVRAVWSWLVIMVWPTADDASRIGTWARPWTWQDVRMFGCWPTAGRMFLGQLFRSFGRGFSIEPPRPVFAILTITHFLLIQMMPIQLRWRVNSLRARGELVLMKSIE
ncbi:unnamed protein product [Microthlaspi erraticum]|uniref:Uncharacterized protein n=1 Tax=Microthlaspi erraticum TaxID=1685480 RepID=A0A6D2JDC9_9BRAS|nr:unnamed protein product [Microthlaspi erraticum]